jgi:hypothetical protein
MAVKPRVTIRVTGVRLVSLRCRAAARLFEIAARVAGCGRCRFDMQLEDISYGSHRDR